MIYGRLMMIMELLLLGKKILRQVVVNYFKSFFTDPGSNTLEDQLKVIQLFPRMFSENDVVDIGRQITLNEVKMVIEGFSKNKSPGLDGWTAEFFINFFDLLGMES
jgi:hypothetical protein